MTATTHSHYDLAILGLGSAGEALASQAARAGLRVIGFEPNLVGGECPFTACMPSKTMLHDAGASGRTWDEAVARRDEVVDFRDDSRHHRALIDAGVEVVRERAVLDGDRTVRSTTRSIGAERVVIATGARPVLPPVQGLDDGPYWTSEDALSSSERPPSLLIVGAGPIGSELSEVYARFGTRVTLVERNDVINETVEPEAAELLESHLRKLGVDVRLGTEVTAVDWAGTSVVATTDGHERLEAARLVVAVGVEPRLEGIGLESIGLTSDVAIDASGRVGETEWLFAAGDVTPQSKWTHGANHQASNLVARFQGHGPAAPVATMPSCIFTDPPLGRVGQTAAQAADQGVDAVVGVAHYSDIARFTTDELGDGVANVVVDGRSGVIIGGSVFGARADDLIQIMTVLVELEATIERARSIVFPFPTIGQVVEVALEDAHRQYRGLSSGR